ncbi:MAG: hypothetical protein COB07_09995 [Sulfurovum sp.]|nr:MAG: hypothetical protein COB07_09995 [Sulfurovum sp.]
MKHIILFALLIQFSGASTLTLKKVLASANNNNALSKSIEQEALRLEARNLADTSLDPMELYGTGTRAHPKFGDNGSEYSVGLLQKLSWGDTQEQDQTISRLNNEANMLEEDKKILNFQNGLKSLYHQHCLDHKNYKSFRQNYDDFAKLYKKKQKAYKYQEISKAELMQLEIEKNKLYAQLQEIQMIQKMSKQKLFILGRINLSSKTTLACSDMYPVRENVKVGENRFQLSKEAYDKRIQSTQVAIERYSKPLDSISLAVQYDKELDVDKYSIGVSIPLSFTSNRTEQERVAAMHKSSAIDFQYEQTMLEKKSMFFQLRSTLKSNALMIKSLKSNLRDYKKNLMPLIKKSYDLGESSVIEYLLNRQNYHQLKQELFATQKAYYRTLFRLYTLSEMKDRK